MVWLSVVWSWLRERDPALTLFEEADQEIDAKDREIKLLTEENHVLAEELAFQLHGGNERSSQVRLRR